MCSICKHVFDLSFLSQDYAKITHDLNSPHYGSMNLLDSMCLTCVSEYNSDSSIYLADELGRIFQTNRFHDGKIERGRIFGDGHSINGHVGYRITALEINCENSLLASAGTDGKVKIWNITKLLNFMTHFEVENEAFITNIKWHPFDRNILMVGDSNGRLYKLVISFGSQKVYFCFCLNFHLEKVASVIENKNLFESGVSKICWDLREGVILVVASMNGSLSVINVDSSI